MATGGGSTVGGARVIMIYLSISLLFTSVCVYVHGETAAQALAYICMHVKGCLTYIATKRYLSPTRTRTLLLRPLRIQ